MSAENIWFIRYLYIISYLGAKTVDVLFKNHFLELQHNFTSELWIAAHSKNRYEAKKQLADKW